MASPTASTTARCPQCGAERVAGADYCWLCRVQLGPGGPPPPPGNPYSAPQSLATQSQFALSSLFLLLTLSAICIGLATVAPGLIVPLVIFVLPAVVRTMIVVKRTTPDGSATMGRKALTFLASIGIVYVVWMAGAVAFFGACSIVLVTVGITSNFSTSMENVLMLLLIAAGGGSLMLVVWLFFKTLPRAK